MNTNKTYSRCEKKATEFLRTEFFFVSLLLNFFFCDFHQIFKVDEISKRIEIKIMALTGSRLSRRYNEMFHWLASSGSGRKRDKEEKKISK